MICGVLMTIQSNEKQLLLLLQGLSRFIHCLLTSPQLDFTLNISTGMV